MNVSELLRRLNIYGPSDRLADFALYLTIWIIPHTMLWGVGFAFGISVAVMRPIVPWTTWSGMLLGVVFLSLIFSTIMYASYEHPAATKEEPAP